MQCYCHAYEKKVFKKAIDKRLHAVPVAVNASEIGVLSGFLSARTINYLESAVVEHKILAPSFVDQKLHERFKLLRTKIVAETQQSGARTFLITSTRNKEGKTFTALNLAITFAREVDHEVLLVDVNVKNPSVLKQLGIDEQPGLLDCLHDNGRIADMLICPGIERLLVLPLGCGRLKDEALLRSRKMRGVLSQMKNRRKDLYIIFDGPALADGIDAIVLSDFIDKTLFVVEHGAIKQHELGEAVGHLNKDKILGAVFNKRVV
jgi:capsular exopolysaccharide synthesis family protein